MALDRQQFRLALVRAAPRYLLGLAACAGPMVVAGKLQRNLSRDFGSMVERRWRTVNLGKMSQ